MKETTIESSAKAARVDKHRLADRYLVSVRTVEQWQANGLIHGGRDGKKNTYDPLECDRRLLQCSTRGLIMTNNETTIPTIERPFLTKKLLAQRYDVCQRTIQNWSNAGLLVCLKRRRVVRYYVPGCDASLVEHGFVKSANPGNL